jgi:hypothetical protein
MFTTGCRWFLRRTYLIKAFCLLFFGIIALFAFAVWYQSAAPTFDAEPLHDYLPQMQELRAHGRYGEAIALGSFVESQPDLPHHTQIVVIKNEIVAEQASYLGKTKRFVGGFLTGDTSSIEGMIGTTISDFLFIGDIRDLSKQGYNVVTGEEVDAFVTTLAAVGLVSSVASWTPTVGPQALAISSKPVLTLLKALKRIGALSNKMTAHILRLAQEVMHTRKLGAFADILSTFGGLAKRAPVGTLPMLIQHADSLDEAATLGRWVEKFPNETVTLMLLKGREGLTMLSKPLSAAVSQDTLVRWLRHGGKMLDSTKLRTTTRLTKFVLQGRIGDLRDALIQWSMNAPVLRRFFLLLSSLSALLCMSIGTSYAVKLHKAWRPTKPVITEEMTPGTPLTASYRVG